MRCCIYILLLFFINCNCNSKQSIVKLDDQYGIINIEGNFIVEPQWDEISSLSEGFYAVKKDSLWGFINKKGAIVINPQYMEVGFFSEGVVEAANFNGEYGFIDQNGDTLIPFIYNDSFNGFENGLTDVYLDEKCGYINKKNEVLIPLIYDSCYPFISEVAQVHTIMKDEWKVIEYLINKEGTVIPDSGQFSDDQLWIPKNPYPYSFKTETGRGRTNAVGDTIIPPIYEATGNFIEGRSIVKLYGKWGFYDENGNLIQEPIFDDLQHFFEGLSLFELNNKYGFVDRNGKIVIPAKFEKGNRFFNGLAHVEFNGKAGFINKKGAFIIPPKFEFDYSSHFQ